MIMGPEPMSSIFFRSSRRGTVGSVQAVRSGSISVQNFPSLTIPVAFLQGDAPANLPATSSLNQMVTLLPDVRREAHVVDLAKQIVNGCLLFKQSLKRAR